MSVTVEINERVTVEEIPCSECRRPFDPGNAVCPKCSDQRAADAAEEAEQEARRDEPTSFSSDDIRDWVATARAKPASDITPEIAALFERCAEDLEVGHG